MRWLVGSTAISSGGSAVQLRSDSMGRVLMFTVSARAGNGAVLYFGHSSAISSVASYQLSSGQTFPRDGGMFTVPAGKGFAPSNLWMNASASSTARLDHVMLIEP